MLEDLRVGYVEVSGTSKRGFRTLCRASFVTHASKNVAAYYEYAITISQAV